MKIHGENINLIPLSVNELISLTKNTQYIASSNLSEIEIDSKVMEAINTKIDAINEEYIYSFKWNTYWLMVEKSTNLGVGLIGFKGVKKNNISSELYSEIGCGVSSKFMNRGYASEALNLMCEWSREQEVIEYVFAQTGINNESSQRVLRKGDFKILCNNHNIIDYKKRINK